MPGRLLTVSATIQCPHGGRVLLTTANTRVLGSDGPVLLDSDVHTVMGCPFTIGTKYTPCVRIEWQAPSAQSSAAGPKPLVETSVGICYGAEGAPQGAAIVASTQAEASAR